MFNKLYNFLALQNLDKFNLKKITLIILLLTVVQTCFCKIDLNFSHKRGYYNAPFNLIIEADNPNAVIRYTTNNTKPTASYGNIYNSSILINSSTSVRVFAYTATDSSNTRTHSYIFLNEVISSNNLYTYITQDAAYSPLMETSFKALPVISLTSNQINGTNHIDTEIETSVEMFFPDGSRNGFMLHSGIQTWGGSPTNPKKHYRLEFKKIYGDAKLDYNIFKADNYDNTVYKIAPTQKFDKLLLRGGSQDALNAEYGAENLAQYVRNRYFMDTQIEMGYPAPHGRFVHVFVNLEYVGQYHLMERPDVNFFESYYGGEETDYEVYKSGLYWDDLNLNLWDNLKNRVNLSSASAMQNTNNYIDLDQTAFYLNTMSYASGFDWSDVHNCLGGTNKTPGQGGYKFIVWDMDFNFGNGGKWNPQGTSITYFDAPLDDDGPVPDNLVGNIEFKYKLADNVECTCYNNGLFTPNIVDSLYMHRINQVTTSLIAESARWGDYDFYFANGHVQDDLWDVNGEFTTELNRIRNNWIPQRTNSMLNYYETNGLKSDLQSVGFNKYGGKVDQNFALNLTNANSNSSIYYTLDGSDPRAFGGSISNTAILYTGSIILPNGPVTIKARVRDNNHTNSVIRKWSAMCPRTFYVNQNYEDLVINEIHYNPNDSIYYNPATAATDTVSGRNFEFVELKNTGDQLINLQGVKFAKGIDLTFEEPLVILPDSFIVVAEDAFWFEQKYGFTPQAVYAGKLENSGETLLLKTPCQSFIDSVRYDDVLPWDTVPDNGKFSLALIDGLSNNALAVNWSKQTIPASPGSANLFCQPITVGNNIYDVSCYGANDGFIEINATGGTVPYNFNWSNGDTTQIISSLNAGNYTLNLTDRYGCIYNEEFIVNEPPQITVNSTFTNETYFQANDGTAQLTVSGGNPPYNYSWSNNDTSNQQNNLAPGNYTFIVTDAIGCKFTDSFVISAIDCSNFEGQVTVTDETYFANNDGTATTTITNGALPYQYLWSNGETNNNVSNLAPGSYSIDVTDALGCNLSIPFTINAVNCSGFSTQIFSTDETENQANDGTALVTASGGTSPYSYSWSSGQNSNSLSNLNPGSYSVNTVDTNGCPSSNNITIAPYVCQNIIVKVSTTDESCFGKGNGLIVINSIQNGTMPYTIDWDSGITGTVNNNLTSGTYNLKVTDNKNCSFNNSYDIFAQSNTTATHIVDDVSTPNANDGKISLSVFDGVAPYTFLWSNGETTQNLINLSVGVYSVTINDSYDCTTEINDIEVFSSFQNCPNNYVENNSPDITTQQLSVAQFIQTNGYVNSGNVVSYKAGDYIELTDSFEVKMGAEFEAIIENCD